MPALMEVIGGLSVKKVHKIYYILGKPSPHGEVGGFRYGVPCTCQLSWLAVERPWIGNGWTLSSLSAQTGREYAPSTL